ncbi:MAG: hypothetical protein E6I27_09665 [Chloroflexi bacterium]|nr:MAG: hypothetical protein E6I96_09865 [Chloroflexota bacterium]TMF37577.1 MAG: hypothetical protein E6I27_09665 [Chloroflexota bacterium]
MSLVRMRGGKALLVAIIALLVLGDLVFAGQLIARRASVSVVPVAAAQAGQKAHPCNHGFYVSQAAHSKKGGAYVGGIAKSDLGKNGSCSAPLPAQAPASTPKASGS